MGSISTDDAYRRETCINFDNIKLRFYYDNARLSRIQTEWLFRHVKVMIVAPSAYKNAQFANEKTQQGLLQGHLPSNIMSRLPIDDYVIRPIDAEGGLSIRFSVTPSPAVFPVEVGKDLVRIEYQADVYLTIGSFIAANLAHCKRPGWQFQCTFWSRS